MSEKEAINHPAHYKHGPYEVINIIEFFGLGFNLGNVIKYILRAGVKDPTKELEDLKKARWYLDREIGRREGTILGPDEYYQEKEIFEEFSEDDYQKAVNKIVTDNDKEIAKTEKILDLIQDSASRYRNSSMFGSNSVYKQRDYGDETGQ